MAQLIWTEPALSDLDAIADYIALDKPQAARDFVQLVFQRIEQLLSHPESGSKPKELRGSQYRQLVVPPCRIFYRIDSKHIYILHVMRGEMRLMKSSLKKRDKAIRGTQTPRVIHPE